ncbi:uncharacterized protein LOC112493953 isoform X2 [Cephus cinctus]|uniref:Uncharacterized protein LOC112493953 isoform X2 n=1 Tax=Cephus cinctus TaxID=211228 RepID=A0AAJ7VYL1_CEPCN|nr:uncharacterized protein LOC112493953 isoform X2 [Cephus cinctus]
MDVNTKLHIQVVELFDCSPSGSSSSNQAWLLSELQVIGKIKGKSCKKSASFLGTYNLKYPSLENCAELKWNWSVLAIEATTRITTTQQKPNGSFRFSSSCHPRLLSLSISFLHDGPRRSTS